MEADSKMVFLDSGVLVIRCLVLTNNSPRNFGVLSIGMTKVQRHFSDRQRLLV